MARQRIADHILATLEAAGVERIYGIVGDSPALQAFRDEFKRDTGNVALPYNITAYDTIRMVVAAMQAAGSTDPVKTADALRHLDYKGLLQDYAFNNANQSTVTININEVAGTQVRVISSLTTT